MTHPVSKSVIFAENTYIVSTLSWSVPLRGCVKMILIEFISYVNQELQTCTFC